MSEFINDNLFEAVLQQAVRKNLENQLAAIPPDDELKQMYSFSDEHNRKMKKLFAADNRREAFKIVYKWGKVAVVAVCVSATLVFGTLLTSAEVRKAIGDVIVTWFSQFTKFQSPELSDDFTEREWTPEYLPEGFAFLNTYEVGSMKGIEYSNSSIIIEFNYKPSDYSTSVDNEDMKYSVIVEKDTVYHIFESAIKDEREDNIIVWDIDGYRFTIIGNYDIDELIKIAFSVK
jgi:hypothetical protein